jgi:hypothetical protein
MLTCSHLLEVAHAMGHGRIECACATSGDLLVLGCSNSKPLISACSPPVQSSGARDDWAQCWESFCHIKNCGAGKRVKCVDHNNCSSLGMCRSKLVDDLLATSAVKHTLFWMNGVDDLFGCRLHCVCLRDFNNRFADGDWANRCFGLRNRNKAARILALATGQRQRV